MQQMNILFFIGIAAILGFTAGKLFNQWKMPAVTGWVVMGVLMGSSMAGIFPEEILSRTRVISDLALGLIAFNIGEQLIISDLKKLGKPIIIISLLAAFGAFLLVTLVVLVITNNFSLALILGAVASATAPAATVMVIQELKARGELTTTILAVVAIDDAIALALYAFAASIAKIFIVPQFHFSFLAAILEPVKEISGALLIGCGLGVLVSLSSRWIKSSVDFFIIVIAAIFVNIGLSLSFGFSELLANMTLGMFIANACPRRLRRISNTWRNSTPILYVIFFCLAGAYLNVKLIYQIGMLGLAAAGARMLGKFLGAYWGAKISGAPKVVRKFVGLSLFPQVGVAVALAMVVGRQFEGYGAEGKALASIVINVLLFTTIITEIVGPYLTRWSLIKSGEGREKTKV